MKARKKKKYTGDCVVDLSMHLGCSTHQVFVLAYKHANAEAAVQLAAMAERMYETEGVVNEVVQDFAIDCIGKGFVPPRRIKVKGSK